MQLGRATIPLQVPSLRVPSLCRVSSLLGALLFLLSTLCLCPSLPSYRRSSGVVSAEIELIPTGAQVCCCRTSSVEGRRIVLWQRHARSTQPVHVNSSNSREQNCRADSTGDISSWCGSSLKCVRSCRQQRTSVCARRYDVCIGIASLCMYVELCVQAHATLTATGW